SSPDRTHESRCRSRQQPGGGESRRERLPPGVCRVGRRLALLRLWDACTRILNLARIDVFPAANDHVLGSARQMNIAVSAHATDVTSMQPAFAIDCSDRSFGFIV